MTIDKPTFIVGDFSCRIDNESAKGLNLVTFLESENFTLLNKSPEYTYIYQKTATVQ